MLSEQVQSQHFVSQQEFHATEKGKVQCREETGTGKKKAVTSNEMEGGLTRASNVVRTVTRLVFKRVEATASISALKGDLGVRFSAGTSADVLYSGGRPRHVDELAFL